MKTRLFKTLFIIAFIIVCNVGKSNAAESITFTALSGTANQYLVKNGTTYVVFGFSITVAGLPSGSNTYVQVGDILVNTTQTNLNNYLTNGKIIKTTDPTTITSSTSGVGNLNVNGSQYKMSNIFTNNQTGNGTSTFYLVFDVTNFQNGFPSPSNITFSFPTTPIDNNTFFFENNVKPSFTTTTTQLTTPATYYFINAIYDWTGNSDINWNNTANWGSGIVPTTNDLARIGILALTGNKKYPTISAGGATSVGGIIFGTENSVSSSLTVNTPFTINNDIYVSPALPNNATTYSISLAGSSTLTVSGNIKLGDGVTLPPGNNSPFSMTSSIANLIVTGNINLNSTQSNGQRRFDAELDITGGTVTASAINTTNQSNNTSTLSVANATLNLTSSTALGALTTTGINVITFNGTGATINYSGANQTIYTNSNITGLSSGVTYNNLTLSGSGTKTVLGGTLSISGNLITTGAAVNLYTNDPTVTVTGNWTNSTTVTQDTGPITITGSVTNNSGGSLALGSADLSIAGNYTNNLGGVYTQSTGTTYFNGSGSQALTDNSATGTTFNKVSFSGGALTSPKTMSGSGGFAVSSTGTLSLANNATTKLDAGGVLTLKSTASSTATVTQILNTTSTIIGNVKVERYFSGGAVATYRGYRLVSSAVNNNSVTNNSSNTALYSLDFLSTSPSSIFTAGPGGTGSGFTSLGAGNSTIYLYREDLTSSAASFNGGNFKGVYAINTGTTFQVANPAGNGSLPTTLPVGNGYMLYYIGDKTLVASKVTRSGGKFADPESSTSTAVGTINQGNIPVQLWFKSTTLLSYTNIPAINNSISPSYARAFNLVGNPYPSSIDWDKFTNALTDPGTGIYGPNLKNSVYVYDYRSKNYGVYQQGTSGGLGTRNSSHIIASGQGFFVKVDSSKIVTAATLTFHEGAKINTQNTGTSLLFKSALVSQILRIKLSQDSINADDIILTFEPEAKNEYESDKDADYLQGIGSAVSLTSYAFNSNKKLAINHMHSIDASMRIKLYASASSSTILDTLSATGFDSLDPRFDVYLIDHYKKDSIFFSKYKQYLFQVDRNDVSSYGSDRFELVFHKNSEYNYHLLGFTAKAVKNTALLTWKVEKETTFTSFTIERNNGSDQFTPLYTVQSNGSSNYTFVDKSPLTGVNNYRLKQVDAFGNITYSTATLNFNNQLSTADDFFSIYPNPVITQFNIKINASTIPKQVQVRVTDLMGNTVINTKNPGDNIKVNAYNLMPGAYIVEVTDSSTQKTLGQKKLIKQ